MRHDLAAGLAWAGSIIAVALGASLARKLGYIDGEAVTRLVTGLNGLMVAWYGNRLPKALLPDAIARRISRVAGWSMLLSGFAYAVLWAFAPIQDAVFYGCAAIIGGIAVTLAYGVALRARHKAALRG